MKQSNKKLGSILKYTILIVITIISIFPFIYALMGATNASGFVFERPPSLRFGDKFAENFQNLNNNIDMMKVIYNSVVVTLVGLVGTLVVTTCAAYAFAKFKFKGRNTLFAILMVSMMVPYHALIIPQFKLVNSMGISTSLVALILPGMANIFAMFLLRQNFLSIPDSLLEAARMDGASEFFIFIKIVMPLMKTAMATASIFIFLTYWNNFLWPLVMATDPSMYTLPVALSSISSTQSVDYGQVMVGVIISIIPTVILFVSMQKQFVSGVLGGSVKG